MPPKNKNKNAQKSPFYHLLVEVKDQRRISMVEATQVASAIWNKMTPQQRQPYEQRALEFRNNVQLRKYTSDGVDVEDIENKLLAEQQWQQGMMEYIHADIDKAHQTRTLDTKMFFVLDFNIFCLHDSTMEYYPAEVGLCAFNLRHGVLPENVYHSEIQPGDLPLGYYGTAVRHSDSYHKIRPPVGTGNTDNQEQVFTDIKHFLAERYDQEGSYVLYVKEKYIPQAKKIFEQWCQDYSSSVSFEIYNLQQMFNALKSALMSDKMPEAYAFSEISKDMYSHVGNIACAMHDSIDRQEHCARSKAVRYAYIICDNCACDLGLELVPGQHVPQNAQVNYRSSSGFSSYATNSSRASSTVESRTDIDSDAESTSTFTGFKTDDASESDWVPIQNRRVKAGLSTKRNAHLNSLSQRLNKVELSSNKESDYSDVESINSGPSFSQKHFPALGQRRHN